MKMVKNGTYSIEVNGQNSDNENILVRSRLGDPKSSGLFNLVVVPLNQPLASYPDILRNSHPIFFADDDLPLLNGSNIQGILDVVDKMKQFERVAGLKLNIDKCEFLSNNVELAEIRRLVESSGMRHVDSLRHLGITINGKGQVPIGSNIVLMERKMAQISERISLLHNTQILVVMYVCAHYRTNA